MQEPQEIPVWSLGGEVPLEEEITTHSSILSWKIPWTEEPGRLPSMVLQRVGHDWVWVLWWWWWCNNVTITIILLPMGKLRLRKSKVARSNLISFGEFTWTFACMCEYLFMWHNSRYISRIYMSIHVLSFITLNWNRITEFIQKYKLTYSSIGFP